jgi:hypothetical protein
VSATTRRWFARAVLGGLATLAFTAPAVAGAPQATVEVMVLHATTQPGKGSIDPSIGNLPQLRRPPFSAFNTYKLLAKQSLTLVKGTPTRYTLVNGRVLQITLTNVLPGPRFEIAAAINQPGGTAYINLLRVTTPPNETFFVAGQQYRGGVIVIGFTLH